MLTSRIPPKNFGAPVTMLMYNLNTSWTASPGTTPSRRCAASRSRRTSTRSSQVSPCCMQSVGSGTAACADHQPLLYSDDSLQTIARRPPPAAAAFTPPNTDPVHVSGHRWHLPREGRHRGENQPHLPSHAVFRHRDVPQGEICSTVTTLSNRECCAPPQQPCNPCSWCMLGSKLHIRGAATDPALLPPWQRLAEACRSTTHDLTAPLS